MCEFFACTHFPRLCPATKQMGSVRTHRRPCKPTSTHAHTHGCTHSHTRWCAGQNTYTGMPDPSHALLMQKQQHNKKRRSLRSPQPLQGGRAAPQLAGLELTGFNNVFVQHFGGGHISSGFEDGSKFLFSFAFNFECFCKLFKTIWIFFCLHLVLPSLLPLSLPAFLLSPLSGMSSMHWDNYAMYSWLAP